MSNRKYIVPYYHKEVFGDNDPKSYDQITKRIFGASYTDFLEDWSKLNSRYKKKTEKFFHDIKTSELINYCTEPGWQYVYPNNKHVQLIEDIRVNGIKVPLFVIESVNRDGYFVVEGHHRAGAAKLLGIEKIKCFVLIKMEEQK